MLPTHHRYGYTKIGDRPVYDWPGGKRLAFYVAANIMGQPFRIRPLRAALQRCLNHGHKERVRWTLPGKIADYRRSLPEGMLTNG